MSTLYVTEQGSSLIKRGKQLIVIKESQILAKIKTFDLKQVVLFGNINISTPTIHFLLKEGIDLVFLSPAGKFKGRLISSYPRNVDLRKNQFKKAEDWEFKIKIAKEVVKSKIENQAELLRRLSLKGEREVKSELTSMVKLIPSLQKSVSLDSIRGFEGRASALYFSALGKIVKKLGWEFRGRTYHPPLDEFNAVLSFVYTLLLNKVENFILIHSLEPILGFFHSEEYGKPALALDLMEEWRPVVGDNVVMRFFRKKMIKKEDFYYPIQENPPYPELLEEFKNLPLIIRKETIRKLIKGFEKRLSESVIYNDEKVRLEVAIERQILRAAKAILGEEDYKGFKWR